MTPAQRFILVWLAASSAASIAVEPLSTDQLLAQCAGHERDPASLDTARCRSYVQGYMGGAYAMRAARIAEPDSAAQKSEFVERAQRTRVGTGRLAFGDNRRAGYCVPHEVTISEIVAGLNRFAARSGKHAEAANAFMLDFLRAEFACGKDEP